MNGPIVRSASPILLGILMAHRRQRRVLEARRQRLSSKAGATRCEIDPVFGLRGSADRAVALLTTPTGLLFGTARIRSTSMRAHKRLIAKEIAAVVPNRKRTCSTTVQGAACGYR